MCILKRTLTILLALVMVFSTMIVTADAATSNGYVYVNATQHFDEVQNALTALNKQRKKAGLNEVKLDEELCVLAVRRAAESRVFIDSRHTRPNGTERGTISPRADKENWAMGTYVTGTSLIDDVWMDSAGHKKNMLYDKAVSAGIGFITVGDFTPYCILILSSTNVKSEMTTKTGTRDYKVKVEVKGDYLKQDNFRLGQYSRDDNYAQFIDFREQYMDGGILAYVLFDPKVGLGGEAPLDPDSFTWTSSNKLIANVNGKGNVRSNYPGTAKITAKMKSSPGYSFSGDIKVNDNYFGFDEYDYTSDPYYPDYFQEDDDDDDWMYGGKRSASADAEAEPAGKSLAAAETAEVQWWDPNNKVTLYDNSTIDISDVVTCKLSDSATENARLLSHITLSVKVYAGYADGYTVNNDDHTVHFNKAGYYQINATGDSTVNVTNGSVLLFVSQPLQWVRLYVKPTESAPVFSDVTLDCTESGGHGNEIYEYTVTDQSGKVVASYSTDSFVEQEWTWVPEDLGTYTIKLVGYDPKTPENKVEDTMTYTVVQADQPRVMPAEEYTVSSTSPRSVILPSGWEFSASDLDREIPEGGQIQLTAHYTAADKYMFKNLDAAVTVKHVPCEHPEKELRNVVTATCTSKGYTGDEYCKVCNMLLAAGSVTNEDPDNHAGLITTTKPAEIFISGHTRHQYCSSCNTVVMQGQEIPAIDSYVMNTPVLTYTGKPLTVNGVFKAGDRKLVQGQDYTAKYSENTNAGNATVTYTFKGDFGGTFEDYFTIEKSGAYTDSGSPAGSGSGGSGDGGIYEIGKDGSVKPVAGTGTAQAKATNPITVKAKTAKVKYKKLKKKNQTLAVGKVLTVSKAQGKLSYAKLSGNKKITINKTTGKVTIKKKLKKGTYKIKVKVSAAGTSKYKAGAKTVTFKIKIK